MSSRTDRSKERVSKRHSEYTWRLSLWRRAGMAVLWKVLWLLAAVSRNQQRSAREKDGPISEAPRSGPREK